MIKTIVGYPKVKLYMKVENYNDMNVFVWLQKLDKFGNVLSEFVVPITVQHCKTLPKMVPQHFGIKVLGVV